MIAALRKKLAILLIGVLGAVVVCTALAALIVSERQLQQGERARLAAQADRIAQDVRMSGAIRTAQLAKTEVADGLIISIQDGGGPIAFRGGWKPETDRDVLLSRALESAPDAGDWNGTVMGDHVERYLAAIRRIDDYRNARTVVVLQDMRAADAQRRVQRLLYAGIAVLAVAVIALFCWFFTGRVTQPIREAHAKQNQFVSAASHELRTPMQVIRIHAEALMLDPPDHAPFVEQILKELTHMSSLCEDMLLLTAATDGRAAEGAPVEVASLVRSAAEAHAAAAEQKGVRLCVAPTPEALPVVEGNEALLQRALNALVDNAVCYTQAGGHVTILTQRRGRTAWIIVEDDGPGVPPELRERIFDRFYRADQSRADRAHSGLGLSVARSIVESHGGRLSYAPVAPHGSRFCIALPEMATASCP